MKITIEYDLETDEIVLTTPYSHRRFKAVRQFNCRECGTLNTNHVIEALRAVSIYEASEKGPKDVSKAVLAYDLQEILRHLGEEAPAPKRYTERGRKVGDGTVTVRTVARKLTFDDLGDLDV